MAAFNRACHLSGAGVVRDVEEAVRWLQRASDLGHHDAPLQLGELYERGCVVARDASRAFELFNVAHERGSFTGIASMGRCLLWGYSVERDERRGVELVREALRVGRVPRAAWVLGGANQLGVGVGVDAAEGVLLYRRAAEAGEAMDRMAGCLFVGHGYAVDREEAMGWAGRARPAPAPRAGAAVCGWSGVELAAAARAWRSGCRRCAGLWGRGRMSAARALVVSASAGDAGRCVGGLGAGVGVRRRGARVVSRWALAH